MIVSLLSWQDAKDRSKKYSSGMGLSSQTCDVCLTTSVKRGKGHDGDRSEECYLVRRKKTGVCVKGHAALIHQKSSPLGRIGVPVGAYLRGLYSIALDAYVCIHTRNKLFSAASCAATWLFCKSGDGWC
jgi:hypothetical protein